MDTGKIILKTLSDQLPKFSWDVHGHMKLCDMMPLHIISSSISEQSLPLPATDRVLLHHWHVTTTSSIHLKSHSTASDPPHIHIRSSEMSKNYCNDPRAMQLQPLVRKDVELLHTCERDRSDYPKRPQPR